MVIFDADYESEKIVSPPTMFDPRKYPFFKMADKMVDLLQILCQYLKIAIVIPSLIGFRCCLMRI